MNYVLPLKESPASVAVGEGGFPKFVLVAADGARAEVYAHGAHVTSWVPAGGTERLFTSSRAEFKPSGSIRGGVPVIFPQFASEGPLPKHGFARNATWRLLSLTPDVADVSVARLCLTSSSATEAIWPHDFAAELKVAVGGQSLELTLNVANTGSAPFTFTAALHTYLRVSDVRQVLVHGLAGHRYRDASGGGALRQDDADHVSVDGELDRVYFDVRSPLTVEDAGRITAIEMDGFADVVVWNPGPTRGAALADMEPDGHLRMLCVEAAVIEAPVTVAPGDRWIGRQRLIAR